MDTDVTPPQAARIADRPAGARVSAGLGRLIAVTGTEPELGISSFALVLAEGFSCRAHSTLIIDANPERGGLLERLDAREISQVSVEKLPDAVSELTVPDGIQPFLAQTSQGAQVLGCDEDRPLALNNRQLADLVLRARSHWEMVIVDCGPRYAGRLHGAGDDAELITLAPRRFRGTADGKVVRTGSAHWPRDRRMAWHRSVVWTRLQAATRDGVLHLVDELVGGGSRPAGMPIPPKRQRRLRGLVAVAPLVALLAGGIVASQYLAALGGAASSHQMTGPMPDMASAKVLAGREIPLAAVRLTPRGVKTAPAVKPASPPRRRAGRTGSRSAQATRAAARVATPRASAPVRQPTLSPVSPRSSGSAAAEFSP